LRHGGDPNPLVVMRLRKITTSPPAGTNDGTDYFPINAFFETGSRVPAASRRTLVAKKSKRKYSKGASKEVESEMRRYKRGTAKSGKGGRGGKVKSRKQAIAIGLSKARKKGKKAPKKRKSKQSS
jgi:Family of unknown function (DUF6496)